MKNYAFLMVNFETPEFIKGLQRQIPSNELYTGDGSDGFNYSLETETHVTLAPCMDNDTDVETLKKFLMPLDNYSCMIEDVSVFENDDYDVLKCAVKCDNLYITNDEIGRAVKYDTEFGYNPHITIAYLKKGCGKKYTRHVMNELVFLKPTHFSFSWHPNNEEEMKQIEFSL